MIALREKFDKTPFTIPPKDKVYSKIRQIRKFQELSSLQTVISPPACFKDNGKPFFRRLWLGDIHNEYQTILIWATNETLSLLRYNSHVFIDGTFNSCPKDYSQCLIIMTYDLGTESFIPCVYALMSSKHEYLYSVVLHEIIFLLEFKWMPKFITCDFEIALIKALKYEFPESCIIGCYFHLKKAMKRKLEN